MDFAHYWFSSGSGGGGYKIGNSLRFRGAQRLERNLTINSNFTLSMWVKFAVPAIKASKNYTLFYSASPYFYIHRYQNASGRADTLNLYNTTANYTNGVYRDTSAWYHFVISWTTTSTAANGINLYVNGVRQTWVGGDIAGRNQSGTGKWNLGAFNSTSTPFEGYMADVHHLHTGLYQPTDFGEFNDEGVWVPKATSFTTAQYGASGFHLDFSDPTNIGADRSGNGNHFTATGFELTNQSSANYDWVKDSPTNNFAVVSPLYKDSSTSNANLTTANTTGKPSILGLAGNGWDGTEGGWTTTGDVDFGQRTAATEISTDNLPDVAFPNPSEHFQVFTGGSQTTDPQPIRTLFTNEFGNGMLLWRCLAGGNGWYVQDTVRGMNQTLKTDNANTETTHSNPSNTGPAFGYGWKTNEAFSGTNGGSINVTGHRNTAAGFSIFTWTGTGADASLYHGLSGEPDMVWIKRRTGANQGWPVLSHYIPGGWEWMSLLQSTNNRTDARAAFNQPTGNFINVRNNGFSNTNGSTYVGYAWKEIPGYSKFGTAIANSNIDGPFVYCGFRPAFVITKVIMGGSGGPWFTGNKANSPQNPINGDWRLDATGVTVTNNYVDLLSNGFKWRTAASGSNNTNGTTILYMAFAEHPFGGGNVSPSPAR